MSAAAAAATQQAARQTHPPRCALCALQKAIARQNNPCATLKTRTRPSACNARLSYFEPKLEFWRQLWRVLERCDVALLVCDARHPLLHFSEALVAHVMQARARAHVACAASRCPADETKE